MHRLTNTTVKRVLPYRVFPILNTRFKKKTEKKAGGQLPLHYVLENIRQVEFEYFEYILSLHPKASRVRTAAGLLPLHIAAMKKAKLPVFKLLIKKYDYACDLKTKDKKKEAQPEPKVASK